MKTLYHELEWSPTIRTEADNAGEGDGRTLAGLAVPFDVELDVWDFWDDYTEVFRKGAFARTIRMRADNPDKALPLLDHHQRRQIAIGAAVELTERDDGLWAAFSLLPTQHAEDVLAAVRAKVTSGLSIGFEPVEGGDKETRARDRDPPAELDLVERLEVKLHEVSICNFPAYESAGVSEIRTAARARARERAARAADHPSIASLVAERDRLEGVRTAALDRWGRVARRA